MFLSDTNDLLLHNLFRSLLKVNNTFCMKFCEKYFEMMDHTERTYNMITYEKTLSKVMLPSFSYLVIDYICLKSVFQHTLDSLGVDIFKPLNYYINYLK